MRRDEIVFHSQLSCAFVSQAAKWKNKHCLLIFSSDLSFKNKRIQYHTKQLSDTPMRKIYIAAEIFSAMWYLLIQTK